VKQAEQAVDTAAKADVVSVNIIETLAQVRKGGLVFDMAQKFQELVQAVRDTGKKGKFKVTLTLTPEDGDSGALTVKDEIVLTKPEEGKPATFFYATEQGTLQREDPRQGNLPGMADEE
jgi:hypothetical protein